MSITYNGQVAIITGSGDGLGRAYALALAARGAKVVINNRGGSDESVKAAQDAVQLIEKKGGEAIAVRADVTKFDEVQAMVQQAMDKWGRVDILINNAGILRDRSFAKMDLADFQLVMDSHVMGAANCCKAVWGIMREQNYGRIVMASSASGLYGQFGQTNYSAAKMALVGLMHTLVMEGGKHDIRVNTLVPTAITRMNAGLVSDEVANLMKPEPVTAGALVLCHEAAPNRMILNATAGGYSCSRTYETEGIYLPEAKQTPENVQANLDAIYAPEGHAALQTGSEQLDRFIAKAMNASRS